MKPKLRIYYKIKITLNDLIESLITAQAHANYQKSVQLTILTLTLVNHGKGALIIIARLIIWCALNMKTEEKLPAKIFVQIKFFFQFNQLCICVGGSQSSRSWLLCSWKNHKYSEKFYEIFIVFIPPRYIWQFMVPCPHFYFFWSRDITSWPGR